MSSDFTVRGMIKSIIDKPITNVIIQVMDSDQEWFDDRSDDILGSTLSKDDGSFEISFSK